MRLNTEVEIDARGTVRPVDPESPIPRGRAFVTWEVGNEHECYLLSHHSLAKDWLRPEEDEAWAYLQPGKAAIDG